MKFRGVHRHTHAFTAGEVALKSLWVDSCAALLRVLTPALIPQLFILTVQRWPTTFLLERISPPLCGLCHQGQSLLTAWTPWSSCGMGTACCTHGWPQQYSSVSTGKVRVVTKAQVKLFPKPNTEQTLAPSPTPASVSSPQPLWTRSSVFPGLRTASWRQHPASPLRRDSPLVLLQGLVSGCSSQADWSSPASTGAHAVLTRGFREGKETCLCNMSPPAPLSCSLQSDRSVTHLSTSRPYWWHFSWHPNCIFRGRYCLVPPISNTTDCPCQQLQPFTTVCSVSRKIQKLINACLLQITCGKISVPHTQCIPNTKENAFQALILILPYLKKKEASDICASIIFHIKSEARLS